MSIALPIIDLSTAIVGTTGIVDLGANGIGQAQPFQNQPGHLRMFNESGSGLQFTSNEGTINEVVPAGAWHIFTVSPNVSTFTWTVIYQLPNPPVTKLILIYYNAVEQMPDTPILGNSPIGIGGTVSTSTTSIVNTGNPAPTAIAQAAPSGDAGTAVLINNDGTVTFGDAAHPGLLTLLGGIKSNFAPITVNGSTSGFVNIYQPFIGNFKLLMLDFQLFVNNVSVVTQAINTAFTGHSIGLSTTGPQVTFNLTSSGVAQSISHHLTLGGAGAAGSDEGVTPGRGDWFFHCDTGFDSVSFPINANTVRGIIIIFGV